jgi:hypothetical protein
MAFFPDLSFQAVNVTPHARRTEMAAAITTTVAKKIDQKLGLHVVFLSNFKNIILP